MLWMAIAETATLNGLPRASVQSRWLKSLVTKLVRPAKSLRRSRAWVNIASDTSCSVTLALGKAPSNAAESSP